MERYNNVKAIIGLVRPFTMLAPGVGVFSGGIIAVGFYNHSLEVNELFFLILAASVFAMLNGASNAFNQVFDLNIDKVNKSYRPIPAGMINLNNALFFSVLFYSMALFLALIIGPTFTFVAGIFTLITVLYSIPPLRLKKRLWVSNITIAAARSWVLLLGGWTAFNYTNPLEPAIWYVGLILFVFLIGASATKDFTDIPGDQKFGMNTLPVIYGVRRAKNMIIPFFMLPFVMIPLGTSLNVLTFKALHLTPLIGWSFYVVLMLSHDTKKTKKTENSLIWVHMYLILMALQVGFALVYLS